MQPDRVTVGLTGLRAADLAHVGAHARAEGNKLLRIRAHPVGNPHDDFEIGANAGAVAAFFTSCRSP